MRWLQDLGIGLWRLLPANPIVVRVITAAGKRQRHHWARLAYLVSLALVVVFGGGLLLGRGEQGLAELAKQATQTFMLVSLVQLGLMCFVAPVFCAGAITQEKDANTYHILLTTPLSNAQIVLGSLFSRLAFVAILLLSGLPIFCITMLYGGVTTHEIIESFVLAACTALLTGSIAILISFLRLGTRRTLFAFFIGIAVYLLGVGLIGFSPGGQLPQAPPGPLTIGAAPLRMSWLAPAHPFLALLVVTGQTPAPDPAAVNHFGWPARRLLASPAYGYLVLSLLASTVMVGISLAFVRRGARQGEPTVGSWLWEHLLPRRIGGRRRPRRVWRNPIAWREAVTRGSAGGRSALRLMLNTAGLAAGVILLIAYHAGTFGSGPPAAAGTRDWLVPLVWIQLAVVLLVVTSTAATTLTREKEALTMELLRVTPLTSRYIVAGMLQGLVRLAVPLLAVPTLTVALFAAVDLVRVGTWPVTTPEAALLLPVQMVAFTALAAMIGLHFSLLSRRTVQAVMVSTAVVLGAAGLLTACGAAVRTASPVVLAVIWPFTPVWGLQALLDPAGVAESATVTWGTGGAGLSAAEVLSFRITRAVFSLIAAAAYLAITYALYTNMVRGFDMTVRRQSA